MNQKWVVSKTNPEFLDYLSRELSVSKVFAQVLINRGFKDTASIKDFLNPSIDSLHDPFLMPDMEKAVSRLKSAIEKNETVLVHGDYDADGITSTALLVSVLNDLGVKTFYHIPDRLTEGYGFGAKGIEKALECGAGLIVTADCGVPIKNDLIGAIDHVFLQMVVGIEMAEDMDGTAAVRAATGSVHFDQLIVLGGRGTEPAGMAEGSTPFFRLDVGSRVRGRRIRRLRFLWFLAGGGGEFALPRNLQLQSELLDLFLELLIFLEELRVSLPLAIQLS